MRNVLGNPQPEIVGIASYRLARHGLRLRNKRAYGPDGRTSNARRTRLGRAPRAALESHAGKRD
eukprot:10143710-Lingulodinium_polyedra.AAC.1